MEPEENKRPNDVIPSGTPLTVTGLAQACQFTVHIQSLVNTLVHVSDFGGNSKR